ncbi:MAG: rhomboid family intramembrane serine protease [Streptosporangiaceae bacterium]
MTQPPQPAPEPETPAPTCYRHPDRISYVSCVRCGRHACPDCLRPAAVGQQCVDCIREANKGTRRATAPFGGGVARLPVVTYTLVALNVLVYIVEIVYPKTIDYGGLIGGAFDPAVHAEIGVAIGDVYRLLSNAFIHEPLGSGFGIFHIAFNMWALIVVGPALEAMLGRLRFIAVYLLSALGGSVLFYLLAPPSSLAIGASGAIFGLFGAWFVVARRLRLDSRMVVVLIVLNLVISFTVSGIAWQAHIGGLVTGAALTAAYAYAPRANRTLIQAGATVAVLILLIAGVVVRDYQLVNTVMLRF